MGECVDTQVDQGVNGRHPSSHLLTPRRKKNQGEKKMKKSNGRNEGRSKGGIKLNKQK